MCQHQSRVFQSNHEEREVSDWKNNYAILTNHEVGDERETNER
jgi:hypothetical protein